MLTDAALVKAEDIMCMRGYGRDRDKQGFYFWHYWLACLPDGTERELLGYSQLHNGQVMACLGRRQSELGPEVC